jgi:Bacterial regulatory proteins, tetR family
MRGYHHGNLRNALVAASVELAAAGGPDAITVRAAARVTGVTPTAVYRHFPSREELLSAVREQAVQRMANAVGSLLPLCTAARRYIHFAVTEPGLFRTVFERATEPQLINQVTGGADPAAWSPVHGLAVLLSGPLRNWPQSKKDEAVQRMLANLTRGLIGRTRRTLR